MVNKKYKEMKKDLKEAGIKTSTRVKPGVKRIKVKKSAGVTKRGLRKAKAKMFHPTDSRKKVSKRASGIRGLMTIAGVSKSGASGAGRPKGSYKHGMPIHEYKKLLSKRKALQQQYQMDRMNKLKGKGLTPEQIRLIEYQRSMNNRSPEPRELQRELPISKAEQKRAQIKDLQEQIDDELEFQRYSAEKTISPSAQRQLTQIRRIQNKGKSDNIRQQRVLQERRIVRRSMNLMDAHKNMTKVSLDFTGVNPDENILMAKNVFKENPENNLLRPRNRHILDIKENTLHF